MAVVEWEFDWDDQNIEKLARRGISVGDVECLLDGRRVKIARNKRNRAAVYKIIGQDQSGRLITVCVKPASLRDGIWRPVTGWLSTEGERTLWKG